MKIIQLQIHLDPLFSITCKICLLHAAIKLSKCQSALPPRKGNETGSKHVELWNVPQIKKNKKRGKGGTQEASRKKNIMKQWATTWLLNDWALKVHLRISLWSRKACLQTRHSGPLGRRANYQSTKIYACGRYRAEAQNINELHYIHLWKFGLKRAESPLKILIIWQTVK